MTNREEILRRSILEFKGEMPNTVKAVGVEFLDEYRLRYLICSLTEGEDIRYSIECVLHEILTALGVTRDEFGDIIGYKYNIDYEIFFSEEDIFPFLKSDFEWIPLH